MCELNWPIHIVTAFEDIWVDSRHESKYSTAVASKRDVFYKMPNRRGFFSLLSSLTVFAFVAPKMGSGASVTRTPSFQALEDGASRLSAGDNVSVSNLTENVVEYPHVLRLSPMSKSFLKQRLSNAEGKHLRGEVSGVHENDLSSALNHLSDALALPLFVRVNSHQLRVLRVRLLQTHAVFMGRGITFAAA